MKSFSQTMKSLLTIFVIASLAFNAYFLVGCVAVSAKRLETPPPIPSDYEQSMENVLDEVDKGKFRAINNWMKNTEGKFVIVLDKTEEVCKAKSILVKFAD